MQAETLDIVDTEYSACSISSCPNDRNLVACGLYQIVNDEAAEVNEASPAKKRLGRCLLSRINNAGQYEAIQTLETAAILDMSWSFESGTDSLALADSGGCISLYNWGSEKLIHSKTAQLGKSRRLCLSLDWNNRLTRTTGLIVASISDGNIVVIDPSDDMRERYRWHAHDYEPWIAAWDYWNTQCVWTGGDDCSMRLWDLRQGTDSPIKVNKKFEGGVTTIQSHPLRENLFAVGSYDCRLRLFDKRMMSTALCVYEVGGGIWRVRWHYSNPTQLLLACMHDGFKVVQMADDASSCFTAVRLDAHGKDALAYGVDWCADITDPRATLVASCSFYDHQMRSWSVPSLLSAKV